MRISTNQIFDLNIRSVLENQRGLSDTQQQLASGKRINKPSDDPVGAAQVVRLTEELDKLTQYQRNNDLLASSLEQQEAILRSINNSANRARVLVIQSGAGYTTDADRKAIGAEIEQIRNEILDLMNSQNEQGEYIFAGFQSESQAFEFNPAASGNKITFAGDDGTNQVQLSDSVTIQSSTSGRVIFEDVLARLNFSFSGSAGISVNQAAINQQGTFDNFHKDNYDPVTPANNEFRLTVLAGDQIQVTNVGTGAVVDTLDFQSGQTLNYQGIEFNLEGSVGDSVDFTLDAPQKKNIAETLHDMFLALTTDDVADSDFREAINDALVGIDNSLASIGLETSSLGGRLNVAQSIEETNLDLEIANKTARSAIEDVDYAEASAEFAKQETALNAALATFPRVTSLSLFDFL
ncbi:flagellar hook-associated protein FlgL [Alteromonas sp. ASW11-36]|uniref:Flagellar hook-associated protein FlgL n=1 Tax=Alteromonas arenosi TaxID=3055817 RepID=A0ABT7SVY0_9ALTE|nr:flagellar hook-associated protein FlgL [Alteromonas sp. ASW11-36]MDM7860164.1 flagellar hook-associated protein FlgL [Alteromonas sp. ASW11-36]